MIEQTEGRAVKVVTSLLPALPIHHRYLVVYMRRPLAQVSASQLRMLSNGGQSGGAGENLAGMQEAHQETLLEGLRQNPLCRLLEVGFPELIADPAASVSRLVDFLGAERLPLASRMAEVVRPELFRNR